ncbi:hypothetical protein NC652_019073 [Populus alba x Populus x berolinensis]|nr:hypothetical protein NC652_019073 [Populus alba x Populus x berolinensis]
MAEHTRTHSHVETFIHCRVPKIAFDCIKKQERRPQLYLKLHHLKHLTLICTPCLMCLLTCTRQQILVNNFAVDFPACGDWIEHPRSTCLFHC